MSSSLTVRVDSFLTSLQKNQSNVHAAAIFRSTFLQFGLWDQVGVINGISLTEIETKLNCTFRTSEGTHRAFRLLRATLEEGKDIFVNIQVFKHPPSFARRRAATFDSRVPRNAGNVFKATTFSGTVEMARVGTIRDFVKYGN